MALTKVGKEGITGISNSSDATFLTATSAEGVTLAGTLAVTGVHTVGTNAVATSEGGAATSIINQGLLKVWVHLNGASFGVDDSFNLTGATDNGTGDYTVTIANDMGNANYSATATGYKPSADFGFITNNNQTFFAAGTLRVETVEHDGGHKQTEFTQLCISFNGDLA
jgi:hypothetical protein